MRCGITNTVALEGAKVPESIKRLTKEKEATALLDGDRGGDLILKELLQVTSVKYVGRAPRGKEIEECNCKEIAEAIDQRIAVADLFKPKKMERPERHLNECQKDLLKEYQNDQKSRLELPEQITQTAKALVGSLEAVLLNEKLEQIERLPVSQLAEKLQQASGVDTLVFDGIITQRIVDIASEKNIKRIIASRVSEAVKPALNVELNTFAEVVQST